MALIQRYMTPTLCTMRCLLLSLLICLGTFETDASADRAASKQSVLLNNERRAPPSPQKKGLISLPLISLAVSVNTFHIYEGAVKMYRTKY